MLNPKEYKLIKTVVLSYEEIIIYDKKDINVHLTGRLNKEIREYEKQGYTVEIGNMTSDLLDNTEYSATVLYSFNVMLYMTHEEYEQYINNK